MHQTSIDPSVATSLVSHPLQISVLRPQSQGSAERTHPPARPPTKPLLAKLPSLVDLSTWTICHHHTAICHEGSRRGQKIYQDINSRMRSTAPPTAPTYLGEPARTREITASLRNWSPLDPRNRTSTRSAVDHCASHVLDRERMPRLPAVNNTFRGPATGLPRTFRTRWSEIQTTHTTQDPVTPSRDQSFASK